MYYSITWVPEVKEKDAKVTGHLIYKAESKEEAIERFYKDPFVTVDDVILSVTIEEISVKDYITEMEKRNRLAVKKLYLHNHYDISKLSEKEYLKIKEKNNEDEEYLNALLEFFFASGDLFQSERELDLDKISVNEFRQFLRQTTAASMANDFEKVNKLFSQMPQKKREKRIPTWF